MATDNTILRQMAREALAGKWGLAIATFLIYSLILSSFSALRSASCLSLLIAGPMMLGAAIFSLSLSRRRAIRLEQIFDGFRSYSNALFTHLLMLLYVIAWTFLFVIPGIIAALSYAMTFYILADNPLLKPQQALDMSKRMMYGYKAKLFSMLLHFLLLSILCVLTLGIGFLWLIPYVNITMAKFYDDIKDKPLQ